MGYDTFEPSHEPQPVRSGWGPLIKVLLLTLVLAVFFLPSKPAQLQMAAMREEEDFTDLCKWSLIWSDEFDGSQLNTSTWTLETINGLQSGNNELEIYTTRPVNFPVHDGKLHITARKEGFGGYRFTSARMTTQHSFSFKYGRIVARVRAPKGKGMWPAVWMMGTSLPGQPWPYCGEIDIFEMVGGPDRWHGGGDDRAVGTAHWQGRVRKLINHSHHAKWKVVPDHVYQGGNISTGDVDAVRRGVPQRHSTPRPLHESFHQVVLEWNQTHLVWLLDEVEFYSKWIDDPRDPGLAAFQEPFFLLLNLAVGGNWPGPPDSTTLAQFPHEFVIDYLRVYQERPKHSCPQSAHRHVRRPLI